MTRHDVIEKINVTRIAALLGVLGAFWLLLVALRGEADDRYITRREYQDDLSAIRGDVRVMRCELVKDCGGK